MYLANSKLINNRVTSFILTIGAMYLLHDYIAARAQLITFILFLLTIFFIEMFLKTRKKRYAVGLVIIPILIANLHAAVFWFYFILYLPYIAEYLVCLISNSNVKSIEHKIKQLNKKIKMAVNNEEIQDLNDKLFKLEERKEVLIKRKEKSSKNQYKLIINKNDNVKWLIVIMIICLFAGLLTPIGDEPYTHLFKLMRGTTTNSINEHQPLVLINNINFIVVLMLFLAILMFTDTKIRLSDLFMLGGLLILTFYTRRQESMFVLVGVFILNRLICQMFDKYDPEGCTRLENIMTRFAGQITTIALILIMAIPIYRPKINDEYVDESSYPVQASDFILANLDLNTIKLYNEYNYGSYLLFRGIPVFIDSRADLYSPEFNEGVSIFDDFISLSGLNTSMIEEKFNKYGITHLIMTKKAKLKIYIDEKPNEYVKIYSDENFVVYERI